MKEDEVIPVYTIGIAAKLLGVCPATLRLWEKKGVIQPDENSKEQVLLQM